MDSTKHRRDHRDHRDGDSRGRDHDIDHRDSRGARRRNSTDHDRDGSKEGRGRAMTDPFDQLIQEGILDMHTFVVNLDKVMSHVQKGPARLLQDTQFLLEQFRGDLTKYIDNPIRLAPGPDALFADCYGKSTREHLRSVRTQAVGRLEEVKILIEDLKDQMKELGKVIHQATKMLDHTVKKLARLPHELGKLSDAMRDPEDKTAIDISPAKKCLEPTDDMSLHLDALDAIKEPLARAVERAKAGVDDIIDYLAGLPEELRRKFSQCTGFACFIGQLNANPALIDLLKTVEKMKKALLGRVGDVWFVEHAQKRPHEAREIIEALTYEFDAGDHDKQIRAARTIANHADIGDRQVTEALIKHLKTDKGDVKKASAAALGTVARQGDHEVIKALLECLESSKEMWHVRRAAATALGDISEQGNSGVIEALKTCLQEHRSQPEEWPVRMATASALGKVAARGDKDKGDQGVIETLTEVLQKDEDIDVQEAAALALGLVAVPKDPVVIKALLDRLQQKRFPNPDVRLAVAATLGELAKGDKETVQALVDCLQDGENRVREAGATALARVATQGDIKILTALEDMLEGGRPETYPSVRRACVLALGSLAKPHDTNTIEVLWQSARYDDDDVVQATAREAAFLLQHPPGKGSPKVDTDVKGRNRKTPELFGR